MQSVLPTAVFYILSVIILGGAILTITRRSAVHSAIWLVVTLVGVAGLYLHLHAEFLSAVQVLLYVGGIMVLFLFVIMLVNLDEAAKQRQFNRQWRIALICTLVLGAELGYFLWRGQDSFSFGEASRRAVPATQLADTVRYQENCSGLPPELLGPGCNTQLIGWALYRDYLLPFEIASVLLLVAILGAVIMAKKEI